MSVKTITTISCDTPACDHTYRVEDASEVPIAEREAARAGWLLTDDGPTYCADCALVVEPS